MLTVAKSDQTVAAAKEDARPQQQRGRSHGGNAASSSLRSMGACRGAGTLFIGNVVNILVLFRIDGYNYQKERRMKLDEDRMRRLGFYLFTLDLSFH